MAKVVLGAACIGPGRRQADCTTIVPLARPRVPYRETWPTAAVAARIAILRNEIGDHAMKPCFAIVAIPCQRDERLDDQGGFGGVQLDGDVAA